MKIPVKLIENYENKKAGDIILVDSHEAHDLINREEIAIELDDNELDDYLLGIDEEVYEELILDLDDKGEYDYE